MTGVPAIRVRHLWHRYAAMDVLRDVDFEVGSGEIFGFIGPNGAGKTTTIRIIATLIEPMAGRVEVDGVDVALEPERVRRLIGYMPDHAGVYERITIREYLEFFADAFRVTEPTVVDAVLELTELRNLQDRLVAALSKGMRQRLQLARILLHDPKVLVLDEPASDLDPRARIEMRDLLLELRELGKTVLLSSHILTELSDVCTSIGILEKGRLVIAGPIGEISQRLESRRMAEAIGAPAPPPLVGVSAQLATGAASEASLPHLAPPAATPEPTLPTTTAGGAPLPGATRKRLRLRVLGDAHPVVPLIAGGGGVHSVEAGSAGQLTIYYTGDDRFVAEVVRHLVSQGVGIVAVEPERNELERIFLEVTRGDLQ
ncbi:MAG: ABC transporter ATP-binding protein [Sorangiineae bacterium]|nr:ABC transporter ATP-binding protein [Polyangiaceae bacterium]MEB2323601.1 ABC transporter ATP-binding protein [Sorangiineae bacterium]